MTGRVSAVEALLLFHGAGGDRDHRLFLALEEQLGLPVRRQNFPYRDKGPGRRPPDRMPRLIESIHQAAEAVAAELGVTADSLVLGGRSMGGRAASLAVAEGLPAAGVVLLSYPLHPPGKPDRLRVDHFGELAVPTLLVQGTRDPFGTPQEFAAHLPEVAGPLTVCWLDGANHDPKPIYDEQIVTTLADWLAGLA